MFCGADELRRRSCGRCKPCVRDMKFYRGGIRIGRRFLGAMRHWLWEIGGGYGEAAAQLARSIPEHNYVVLEVHEAGIGALMNHLAAADLHNVRVVAGGCGGGSAAIIYRSRIYIVCVCFFRTRGQKNAIINGDC